MKTFDALREILLPVLGLDSIDGVHEHHSLVLDLGADSIDFVEIIYEIEQKFGVILKTNEIIAAGVNSEDLLVDGRLSKEGARLISEQLPDAAGRYRENMTKIELFSAITVSDLARIIEMKKEADGNA